MFDNTSKNDQKTKLTMNFRAPEDIYQELFFDMHMSGIWSDGKMISDMIPKSEPHLILKQYRDEKEKKNFDLKHFADQHFHFPSSTASIFHSDSNVSLENHIRRLWDVLKRPPDQEVAGSSLIPLKYPYVVPGGRFNEIYYWDSYFTMLGLKVSEKADLIESMVNNFSDQIDHFGFIPNGNRTYFLSRSQPPFFSLMVKLLADIQGEEVYERYKEAMVKEHDFWMRGVELVDEPWEAIERIVKVGKKKYLNRYFDNISGARSEMYKDDLEIAEKSEQPKHVFYLNIKSACESGWDFSSRWFGNDENLEGIKTSCIIPVDLHCLLYHLELTLSKAFNVVDSEKSKYFGKLAKKRIKDLMLYYNDEEHFFCDIDIEKGKVNSQLTLAGMFPLYFKMAKNKYAKEIASIIEKQFLAGGGVKTTLKYSGQQWDAPNGWAPLQWITIKGLENYGFKELAEEIKSRWLSLNEKVYRSTGKMMEKYNVEDLNLLSGGGEYPVQDGFGWTNGVYLALKSEI